MTVQPDPGDLPMPNDKLADTTVVASTWTNDDVTITALVLLLADKPDFYAVADLLWSGTCWMITHQTEHRNINDAVREYADRGGDN